MVGWLRDKKVPMNFPVGIGLLVLRSNAYEYVAYAYRVLPVHLNLDKILFLNGLIYISTHNACTGSPQHGTATSYPGNFWEKRFLACGRLALRFLDVFSGRF
jgi:hypothetical protein